MINLNDVLLAMSNIPVDDPIAEIWGRGLQGGYKIIEYTGSLPITITANGDALLDYRIYGDEGGVGVATENLFDINNLYSTVVVQGQTFTKPASAYFFDVFSGTSGGSSRMDLQKSIPVTSGTYTLSFEESETPIAVVFSDGETQTVISSSSSATPRTFDVSSDGYISIRCENPAVCSVKKLQIVKASTAPESYIPYGYKLPMVTIKNLFDPNGTYEANKYKDNNGTIHSHNDAGYYTQYMPINSEDLISVKNARGNYYLTIRLYYYDSQKNWIGRSGVNGYTTDFTEMPLAGAAFIQLHLGTPYAANADKIIISQGGTTTPVYIGENQLDAGEYVSYGEQKIYRDVDGTLTPTDPPVPLPQIPTIDGTTIIDYDGDPKPSQMYVKYKGKG